MENVVCANSTMKELIVKALETSPLPEAEITREVAFWSAMPDCGDGILIKTAEQPEPSAKPARKKREPSEYNKHIGRCMKDGKDMRTCAAEYKAQR